MKFAVTSLNRFMLAGLLATVGAGAAVAQAPAPMPAMMSASGAMGGPSGHHGDSHMDKMGHQDPAKMQAWIAKHQADLKAKLKITAAQEAAWSRYTTAMQPPAAITRITPEQRAEMDKLTTPARIDKMQALRTQRMTEMTATMNKRDEATKAFYAALTPEQQKIFDAEHPKRGPHEGGGPHEGSMQHKR